MEITGVLAAILSSAFGGTAVGATRYLAGTLDPLAIGAVRFGGGFLVLAAVALWRRDRWPPKSDWLGTGALGLLFFGLFPVLFKEPLSTRRPREVRLRFRHCLCSPCLPGQF